MLNMHPAAGPFDDRIRNGGTILTALTATLGMTACGSDADTGFGESPEMLASDGEGN